jgi:hypothetical protein
MPDRNEADARSERAIAAFLGDATAPDPGDRPTRRRHRARRPPGTPVLRTDLVISLAGGEPETRVVHAVSTALRETLRASDEVVEMAGGRLRVTLEADARGGDAFLRRARTVLRPWLGLIDPDLELRVERGPRPARGAEAAGR